MKILYTIADLQPESGGPSRSVSALATAVAQQGNDVELVALEYGSGSNAPMVAPKPVLTTLVPCRGAFAKKFRRTPEFEKALRKGYADYSEVRGQRADVSRLKNPIIHDNGLWLPTNHTAARVARQTGLPLIVSPRGMLTPWAMRFHGFKKRLAWLLYQCRDLQSARVLHATSHQEAAEFRALGLKQPIAVIPNGVAMPGEVEKSEGRRQKAEAKTLLFLSRIHPKKGLLDLVEAWATVIRNSEFRIQNSEMWQVVIAGGDENGHLAEVKAAISKYGAGSREQGARKFEESFQFIGEVADEAKWDLYQSADLFVLPTYSENFGIVIAEALACGVPVITTRGTPWEDLITHRCGWWVEIGPKPLAEALKAAMKLPDEERQAMGLRGRKLVEGNYTWSAAAKKMVAVYRWMLESGPKPEWVV